jgi:hypothetical protein
MELSELAEYLGRLTEAASEAGTRLTEEEWRQPWAAGKWTKIEVLGHLVDSAAHNHQRFARALHEDSVAMPGYNGDAQVRVQRYATAPIAAVMEAWRAQNRLIGYVLAQIPVHKEQTPCTIGALPPMTLRELAMDYVAHLEHHLRQMLAGIDPLKYSGMAWPPKDRWQ